MRRSSECPLILQFLTLLNHLLVSLHFVLGSLNTSLTSFHSRAFGSLFGFLPLPGLFCINSSLWIYYWYVSLQFVTLRKPCISISWACDHQQFLFLNLNWFILFLAQHFLKCHSAKKLVCLEKLCRNSPWLHHFNNRGGNNFVCICTCTFWNKINIVWPTAFAGRESSFRFSSHSWSCFFTLFMSDSCEVNHQKPRNLGLY